MTEALGSMAAGRGNNVMSVDVEDYYQVSAFENTITQCNWGDLESRVERNTDNVLALFDEHDVVSTFFVLGWVVEKFPGLVRRIAEQGHEVASHGYSHIRATTQSPDEFRADVTKTKHLLEEATGTAVLGYRAASFSFSLDNLWAYQVLAETGHSYSSSIVPVRHDLYGIPLAPRSVFEEAESKITEAPVSSVRVLGRNWPCGGGGFFRLLPYAYSHWALSRIQNDDKLPLNFYFHPWEIDPDQPRIESAGLKSRIRHYSNLKRMKDKLRRLLSDFQWGRMDHSLAQVNPPTVDLSALHRSSLYMASQN